jgi:N-acetylmuramic acid 6-phosphate etherase
MISTTTMVRLGRVQGNSMVNVKLINDKITDRAVLMLMEKAGLTNYDEAKQTLMKHGTVREAMEHL